VRAVLSNTVVTCCSTILHTWRMPRVTPRERLGFGLWPACAGRITDLLYSTRSRFKPKVQKFRKEHGLEQKHVPWENLKG
jgi:hypothetical protein